MFAKFARKKEYETGWEFVIFPDFDKLIVGMYNIARISKILIS